MTVHVFANLTKNVNENCIAECEKKAAAAERDEIINFFSCRCCLSDLIIELETGGKNKFVPILFESIYKLHVHF